MGFFDTDRWNEIWQTISRNRKRSIMTALGVFWGIFMLTVLLGAGMGLGRLFRAQLGDMSTNTLLIQPSQTSLPYKGMPKNRWWRMNNDDVENVRGLKEVQYASGVYWGGEIHCSYNERKGDYSLMGYMPDYQQINPQKIIYGRFINDVDMAQKRKVCVIGTQIQKDLFPGMEDPTGKVIKVNNSYFTIIGVMRRQSTAMSFSNVERTVVAPISLAQQMYGGGNSIHMLAIAGRTVLTVPGPASVERRLAMLAVRAAGLELREEAFGRADLPSLDELFFADHRGVTSLSRCDGQPLMTFVAERIAEAMEGLFPKK